MSGPLPRFVTATWDPTQVSSAPNPGERPRHITLAPDFEIHFKSPEDAAACGIELGGGRLCIDPSGCAREVRLLWRFRKLSEVAAAAPPASVFTVAASMDLASADGGAGVQWIALLHSAAGGHQQIWTTLAKRPAVAAAGETLNWTLQADAPPSGQQVHLSLQLAGGSARVELGRLTAAVQSVTLHGRLDLNDGAVQGAWAGGSPASARLWIVGQEGARPSPPLDTLDGARVLVTDKGFSFTVSSAALQAAFGAADLATASFALTVADALVAQVGGGESPESRATTAAPQPRTLSFQSAELIAAELLVGDIDLVRGTLRTLYEQRDVETVRRIRLTLGSNTGRADLDAYLAFTFARLVLARNLHGAGLETLEPLMRSPPLLAALQPAERDEARSLLVNAAVRAGAIDRAVHELNAESRAHPADWRPRFGLGLLRGFEAPTERRLQYRLALAVEDHIPFAELAVVLEAMLDEGRAEDALVECLRRFPQFAAEPQAHLLLADIHLALGRPHDWAAHANAVFEAYGLSSPLLDGESAPGDVLAALSFGAPEAPASREGPLVTVVMPAFNAADTVEHAMRSVLRQTHGALRLVVVDDASTDDTRERIQSVCASDPRASLLVQPENRGPYAAKNRALQEGVGDYVTFHDADDWMHPEHLARHLRRMAEGDLVCSTSSWFRMGADGRAAVRLTPGRHGYIGENPASAFVPREVLSEVGFFDDVRAAADSEFLHRLRRRYGANRSARLSEPLAVGLHRPDSITTAGSAALDAFRSSATRNAYWESWMTWHEDVDDPGQLSLPYPHAPRRFAAPPELTGFS